MSVSQLSPGDKLSLKGKLFELQKKLTIIDIESKQQPEYTFRPEIKSYALPSRHEDFSENMRRAEDARLEKLNSLRSTLDREQDGACPFSPTVISRRPAARVPGEAKHPRGTGGRGAGKGKQPVDVRPAYERLYERGGEYRKAHEARKERAKQFDDNGKKLFSPSLPAASRRIVERGGGTTVGVDDFLYRAAVERSERLDNLRQSKDEELKDLASRSQVNKHSEGLLRKKYEREARAAFDILQQLSQRLELAEGPPQQGEENSAERQNSHCAEHSFAELPALSREQDNEDSDTEVSLGSDGDCASEAWTAGSVEPALDRTLEIGLNVSAPTALRSRNPHAISLRVLQEAMCMLCDEETDDGVPLWRHEDGRHCVAGGSTDPYHLAALVWAQLIGKEGQDLSEVELKKFAGSCVKAMLNRKKGYVDLLSHFVSRVNMLELEPPPPPPPSERYVDDTRSRSSVLGGGWARGYADGDSGASTIISASVSGIHKRSGAYPTKRPPGMNLAEVTRLNALEHERRVELMRRESEAKEMEQCTFAPRLFTRSSRAAIGDSTIGDEGDLNDDATIDVSITSVDSMSGSSVARSTASSKLPVHERLYALKSKLPNSIAKEKHRRKEDIELDECTFTPSVRTRVPPPPRPVFAEGVDKALPQLAESAGIHILGDGDIVFGSSITPAVQSLQHSLSPCSSTANTAAASSSKGGKKLPLQTNRSSPPKRPPQATEVYGTIDSSKRRISNRPSSFISVMEEFKQSDKYSSPGKDVSGRTPSWPGGDESSDSSDDQENFIGYTFEDMEYSVRKFENSLHAEGNEAFTESGLSTTGGSGAVNPSDPSAKRSQARSSEAAVPHGYTESIVRARLSRELRVRQQMARQQLGDFSEERYMRSRSEAAKGAKPFTFHATQTQASAARVAAVARKDETQEEPSEASREETPAKRVPKLYIDVKLGSMTKVPKIAVTDMDDPAALAKDFCRIYGLRGDTVHVLTDVITNSMIQNGIPMAGQLYEGDEGSDNERTDVLDDREVSSDSVSMYNRPPLLSIAEQDMERQPSAVRFQGQPPPPPPPPRVNGFGPRPPPPPASASPLGKSRHVDTLNTAAPSIDNALGKYFLEVDDEEVESYDN